MTITNIISAIGNNSSVYPLIMRDCGIEIPAKIALTYDQNKKESKGIAYLAARERFLDEYATSAVWLGGIPLVGWLVNKYIKARGLNPDVNLKLFKEEQNIQGIDYNIKKFKDLAPDAVKDLIKAKENKKLYEKLLADPTNVERGTVKELAEKFDVDVMTMVGFLDGINDSLKVQNPIEEMEEDTVVNLGFDTEMLYKNMVDAKADWLYNLPAWDEIFDAETKHALYLEQKKSGTVVVGKKIGRNDPCPCGSGKKYKKCCGKNA